MQRAYQMYRAMNRQVGALNVMKRETEGRFVFLRFVIVHRCATSSRY